MNQTIEKNVEWFASLLKKYGLLVAICLLTYWVVKRSWFWFVMPILGMIFVRDFLRMGWFQGLSSGVIIVSWVFVFSFLTILARKVLKCEE